MTTSDFSSALWRTSSYSDINGGHCVEVATTPTHTAIRDTKHRHHTTLTFPTHEWHALIHSIKHSTI